MKYFTRRTNWILQASILHIGLCFFAVQQYSWGQRIRKITTNDGLAQGFVAGVAQSKEGYIWASSLNGLNRYDGEQFKVYRHNAKDSLSLSSDFVIQLFKDQEQNLWNLNNDNVQVYDAENDCFITPRLFKKKPLQTQGAILFDASNRLWLSHKDTFFYYPVKLARTQGYLDPQVSPAVQYRLPPQSGMITTLCPNNDLVYIGTDQGSVYTFSISTGVFSTVPLPALSRISRIWIDPNFGGLWIQTFDKAVYSDPSGLRFFDMTTTNSVQVIKGMSHGGATYFFSDTAIWRWDNRQLEKLSAGIPEYVLSACLDHQGNIWVGTNAQGLRYIELEHYTFPVSQPGFCNNHVVVTAPDGNAWVYEPSEKKRYFGHYRRVLKDGGLGERISETPCHFMAVDAHNRFWFELVREAWYIDQPGGSVHKISLPPTTEKLYTIHCSSDNQVWMATVGLELVRYNASDGTSKLISLDDKDIFSPGAFKDAGYYSNFLEDRNGWLWIGLSAGLIGLKWDEQQQKFQKITWNGKIDGIQVLKEHGVLAIATHESFPDVLWVGTPSGLVRWHIPSRTGTLISEKDGLPDSYIYSVISGGSDELWLGTNKGLVGYNPATNFSRLFNENDGLPAAEFNTSCMVKSKVDNTLFLNTVSGVIAFKPSDLKGTSIPSRMVLTGVRVNDNPVSVYGPQPGSLTLAYDENSITIDFALLCFTNADANRYEYKLNEEDGPWQHLGTKNTLTFPLMSPGVYTVWIRGITSDGQISEPVQLKFTILWPWWKTWWAYLLYFVLVSAVLFLGIRGWTYFERVQNQMRLKEQESSHKVASEQQRLRLLSNITHEVRTPLTVILGQAQTLKKKLPHDMQSDIMLLEQGANELFHLSNQVLQLSKNKKEVPVIHPVVGDMALLIRQVTDYYQYLAKIKLVQFELVITEDALWSRYDENTIKSIISNLLSNAIKFTPAGGTVRLSVRPETTDTSIAFIVSDTGIGMSKEVRERIFERFYQAENAQKQAGTGIGLSFLDELVQLAGGSVTVESEEGKGSVFTVKLPYEAVSPLENTNRPESVVQVAELPENEYSEQPNLPLILVVEDNPAVGQYISKCLDHFCNVMLVSDGIAGYQQAVEKIPDLVITDVMMPGPDGREFCGQIKANTLTNHIPVVMITALGDDADRIEGLRSGADAYLAKPFLQEELVLVVKNLLDLQIRLREQLGKSLLYATSAPTDTVVMDTADAGEPRRVITKTVLEKASPLDLSFLKEVMDLIEDNFASSDFTLMELHKGLGLSRTQLYRKMIALTGNPAGYYLRLRRLEEGMYLLQNRQDMNVTEIGYACGFNDPNYFSTAFSAEFGHSPTFYRKGSK